jgi:hypothetical protein
VTGDCLDFTSREGAAYFDWENAGKRTVSLYVWMTARSMSNVRSPSRPSTCGFAEPNETHQIE